MNTPKIPCEIEAEIAIIGCIFLDQSVIDQVQDTLTPDQFYDKKNKLIFSSMLQLAKNGKGIDATTVIAQLTTNNLLDQSGGIEYISELIDHSYSTANVESYVELIESAALRRKAIATLNDLAQAGYDTNVTAFDYLEYVEKNVFDLSKSRRVEAFKHVSAVSKNVFENTERNASRSEDVIGLDTGYSSLNKITQGFQEGQLIILAARPAMGKSAMALNLATNVCNKNKNGHASVAVFSLEMSAEQLFERMVAADSSIKLNQIKNGKIFKNDWIRFNTSCSKLSGMNLYFDDSSDSTIAKIRAKCRKLKAESGLDFVVIDYLQLIESDSQSARASQQEKITKITRSLKLMARELEVPVLALSQLSRAVEQRDDKRPIMADLRDSGSIEQDADIVMFLYRDEYYNRASERKGEADLIISKNRSGSTSEGLPFMFAGEYQRFKEKKDEDNK
ncbi:MAG: replicative DNA helicase [Acholeplasmatales bacterium]|nr:replicative DNA helicase [Acholeplasmatales bacterium]